jgi:hypothetical protein
MPCQFEPVVGGLSPARVNLAEKIFELGVLGSAEGFQFFRAICFAEEAFGVGPSSDGVAWS